MSGHEQPRPHRNEGTPSDSSTTEDTTPESPTSQGTAPEDPSTASIPEAAASAVVGRADPLRADPLRADPLRADPLRAARRRGGAKLGVLGRLARADRLAPVGAALLAVIVLVALLAPWIAPYPADGTDATHPLEALLPPSGAHWFGTDEVGRDLLTRVMYGARTSLFIAVAVLAVAASVGVTLGVVAGYAGGLVRDVIMRITDVFLAFPALLLSLALAVVLSPGVTTIIIAIAATWWPWYARLTASVASSVATRGFVDAARCLGVPAPVIVFRHVLPNSLTPVLVQLSLDAGGVILTSAALSYLGLGAREPVAEWGLMVEQGQTLFTTNWWVVTFPGLAIMLTAFAFNVLGEGLRAALDPRRVTR